jgi:tetratricopeptide (TPR) repeat protein
VFEQLRDEVTMRSAIDAAEADYQRALVLQRAGDIDECVPLLLSAAREPAVRFAAASLLGRIFKQGGLTASSIEWFEQAAEASAPEPSAAHEVLYELADTLESAGEPARALACLARAPGRRRRLSRRGGARRSTRQEGAGVAF